jgi:alkylation response protein AidB-like acyl-CoA dehydrogenase
VSRRAGTLGISDDHLALHRTVAAFLADRCPREVPRSYLDDSPDELPPFWDDIVGLGWLGIHLPESLGGGGGDLSDLAVVLEEIGRVVAPGPFLPTVLASAVIDRLGTDEQRAALLPGLAAGATATVAFGEDIGVLVPRSGLAAAAADSGDVGEPASGPDVAAGVAGAVGDSGEVPGSGVAGAVGDSGEVPGSGVAGAVGEGGDVGGGGGGILSGRWRLVPSAGVASVLVLPAEVGGRVVWCVVHRDDVRVAERGSVDPTRRVGDVEAEGVAVPGERVIAGGGREVAGVAVRLLGAEAVGSAAWCVEMAAEHAGVREQFGRPIGQFQAVKHRCADMLCALELARAAAWDAVRANDFTADAAAAALAPDALLRAAEGCIQVLGGMGFTWESDAHLYLKRAMAVRAMVGPPARWRARAVRQARDGERREMTVDLPAEAEVHRAEVRAFVADLRRHDTAEWRGLMVEAGYTAPHWPKPWGRGAGALEQLVINEELAQAGVRRPHLQIAGWALPTIIVHGTREQQERWVATTLRGEVSWCQLFSEPGAGSDLASLTTKAERTEGGWLLTGQKVWTTMAAQADLGICLARSDAEAPRHEGITCFVVDMRAPGVDIRPLRELTGHALFNEVFLSDVFVPDDAVVGPVGEGWRAARTTLGNERVSMGSGSSFGLGESALLALLDDDADAGADAADADPTATDEAGRLLVEAQALAALGLRQTLRALGAKDGAAEPGPEASVRKLLAAEHDQKVQELGWTLLGRAGAATDGPAATWVAGYLANRCLTIAGGTSEIQRNVIAERLLDLPRDP